MSYITYGQLQAHGQDAALYVFWSGLDPFQRTNQH
jgi:hypothetical protein